MQEIPTSITASKARITVDDLIVDKHTGEILGRPSVFDGRIDYMPELRKCRSVDDLQDFLSFIDRRKLPARELHSLYDEVDYAHGEWRRTSIDCRITIPQLRLLEKLHSLILYCNIIIMTQADLAKALGTVESNLMKKLRVLMDSNLARVCTSRDGSIRKGEVKLSVNPRLIFRGDDYRRERYIEDWYRPVGYLHTGALHPNGVDECLAEAA